MTLLQNWRRFIFFEKDLVKDPENPTQPFLSLQDLALVGCEAIDGLIYIGESNGAVYCMKEDWTMSGFRAYKLELSHLCCVARTKIMVTIGQDEQDVHLLKVWHMDKMKQDVPYCSRVSQISVAHRNVPVSALAVHPSLQCMAIGFQNSSLLVYKGDVTKERYSSRPTLVRDGLLCASDGSVTGLAFVPDSLSSSSFLLYLLTERRVFAYTIVGGKEESKIALNDHGAPKDCWTMAGPELDNQFIVVRSDAVYFYQPDCQGQCYVFEGEKTFVASKGCYVVIVTKDVNTPGMSDGEKMNLITVYDIPNMYIAFSAPVSEVLTVVFEWGCFNVITKSGKVYQLREKTMQDKLDILFRKNLYDLAASLAKRLRCDDEALAQIYSLYGNHLYQKGDYENAVQQYIKTIGKVEASFVIRKFLDAQRIQQLAQYLEALHTAKVATKDHTTILLNCYTKLSDTKKLSKFVNASGQDDALFDVDTGISVLRKAGHAEQALQLAGLHKRYGMYLHILLEDLNSPQKVVEYISRLHFEEAERQIMEYGKILLEACPEETTKLIKSLCSGEGYYTVFAALREWNTLKQSDLLKLWRILYLGQLIWQLLKKYKNIVVDSSQQAIAKARADKFMHIFVNEPTRLKEFLEYILQLDCECESVLYNTLLELYLQEYSEEKDPIAKAKLKEKIQGYLGKPSVKQKLELDQALILCQMYHFNPGTEFIYEEAHLLNEILLHHMDSKNYEKVIETCRSHGSDDKWKDMWADALWFFARDPLCPSEKVSELLNCIDDLNILPPVMVLEILSHSPVITLDVTRDYLLKWLKSEKGKINRDEALIKKYQDDIKTAEGNINAIKSKPQIFQVSRCSACDHPLEVPTVHFLCKHSYHTHCFESYAENESECPVCLPETRKLREQLSHVYQKSDSYQALKSELESSHDAVETMAEFFGRGLFQPRPKDLQKRRTETSSSSGDNLSAINRKPSRSEQKTTRPVVYPKDLNPFDKPAWYE